MLQIFKHRIFRWIGNSIVTVGFAGLATWAVVIGANFLAQRADVAQASTEALAVPVSVKTVKFDEHYTTTRSFFGQVEARADAVMSFETGGRLIELRFDEGDFVAKGDVVAQLNTDLLESEQVRLQASHDAITAQLEFAQTRLKRALELQADGFTSRETLDQAQANRDEFQSRIAEIDALLTSNAITIGKARIIAPFDGQVTSRVAEETETVSPGQPVLTMVQTGTALVRVGLPLDVPTDALSEVTIDIDGSRVSAVLERLRPDIDPVTRTRTAIFAISGDVPVSFGQTATLMLKIDVPQKGTWVPMDAMQQGSGSIWTVLVVQEEVVRTADVQVLYAQGDRAYVRGTFEKNAQLIYTGAHRVVPGQLVTINGKQE